ncbi:hypothetical protein IWQ60_000426 [Tieghemiomyces parasiticus]|uniref:Protein PBN1 n=1 Tax=Tieghemiomyces parasiticus TaxID=78921 RepID=A0A9W8AFY2_9FUNG|nr:hypothetical protein IWQ60_000426 [Tieghemiomyces parasiticus]
MSSKTGAHHIYLIPNVDRTSLRDSGGDSDNVYLGGVSDATLLQTERQYLNSAVSPALTAWPLALRSVQATVTDGWRTLLGLATPADANVAPDRRAAWLNAWLAPEGLHLRIEVEPAIRRPIQGLGARQPPESVLRYVADNLLTSDLVPSTDESSEDDADITALKRRLSRALADPRVWVPAADNEFYLYLDSHGTPDLTARWDSDQRYQTDPPAFSQVFRREAGSKVAGTALQQYTRHIRNLDQGRFVQTTRSWSQVTADEVTERLCLPSTRDLGCADVTLLTSYAETGHIYYRGLELLRTPETTKDRIITFSEPLLAGYDTYRLAITPERSLHPHIVLTFLAEDIPDPSVPARMAIAQHLPTLLFADPYQLAEHAPAIGPFHHYGPTELELPMDRMVNWGSLLVNLPTLPSMGQAGWSPDPTVNVPLHTRYKLSEPMVNDPQVWLPMAPPLVFQYRACRDADCPSYPDSVADVLVPDLRIIPGIPDPVNATLTPLVPETFVGPDAASLVNAPRPVARAGLINRGWLATPLTPAEAAALVSPYLPIPIAAGDHAYGVYLATQVLILGTFLYVAWQAYRSQATRP